MKEVSVEEVRSNVETTITNNNEVFQTNADELRRGDEAYKWARYSDNNYELSTKGDSRFSALNAKLKDGRTIEEAYQLDVKGYRSQGNYWKLGKGKAPLRNISKEQTWQEYKALWKQWALENSILMKELAEKAKGKVLTDMFATTEISQARALTEILNEQLRTESLEEKGVS